MRIVLTLLLISLSLPAGAGKAPDTVRDYRIFTAVCADKKSGKYFFALRRYVAGGGTAILLVDPESLETALRPIDGYTVVQKSMEKIRGEYKKTNYIKALAESEKNIKPAHNAGIRRFSPDFSGAFITADLCPSSRPLDRNFFTALAKAFEKTRKPVPVALSVSGLWLKFHRNDFDWLMDIEQKGMIAVTWVNHSYNHYGSEKLPMEKNFLLKEKIDIVFEVLETEKTMISSGVVPSVFFRFPGLVSSEKIFMQITACGLIPLGSDSWLSKGQKPKSGSIVLVHANGNDPAGITRFNKLLESHRESIAKKYWNIYDIREGASRLK